MNRRTNHDDSVDVKAVRARGMVVTAVGLALAPMAMMSAWPSPLAGVIGALSATGGVWLALRWGRRAAEAERRETHAAVAMIAHDLRTPIASVLGYSGVLHEEPGLSEHGRAGVAAIRRNAEHLLALANDVLDVARMESGTMTVQRIDMDPAMVIAEVLAACRPLAEAKGLVLSASCESPIPRRLESDPLRLRQIVMNLVANAIAYTPKGSVRVVLMADESRLRIEVRDTGIGMNAEQVGRLFRPFSRVGGAAARSDGGTGLGLHIARDLARRLGGDIDVQSREGVGSTFAASVAMGSASGDRHTPVFDVRAGAGREGESPASRRLAGMRVLVADDSVDIQRLLRHHLERAGAAVVVVGDGEAALEELGQPVGERPGLALIDVQMPGVDGCEVARRLRVGGGGVPLVALSASIEERTRCLGAGFDDFATKPIEPAALVALCERWGRRDGKDAA